MLTTILKDAIFLREQGHADHAFALLGVAVEAGFQAPGSKMAVLGHFGTWVVAMML